MAFKFSWFLLSVLVFALTGSQHAHARTIKASLLTGLDSPSCGTTWQNACQTLPGALQVADNNDIIMLNGTGTSLQPYNCKLQTLQVSFSITVTSWGDTNATISCPLLKFTATNSFMTANLTRLVLVNTSIAATDTRILLQEVFVLKSRYCAICATYTALQLFPYASIVNSTFMGNAVNTGQLMRFDVRSTTAETNKGTFIFEDMAFVGNNATNCSLLQISFTGLSPSDRKVTFSNLIMENNNAFRGIFIFSQDLKARTQITVADSLSHNNYWEWSGIEMDANNSHSFDVYIIRSRFISNKGLDVGAGPGSCIHIDVNNGPSMVRLSASRFVKNKAQRIERPVIRKYGCVHIEQDGDSIVKLVNVTSLNGETSAVLYRFERSNNTLEIADSTFIGQSAAFGSAVLMETLICKFLGGDKVNCFYDTSKRHSLNVTLVNSLFLRNGANNKGGAVCIAPDGALEGSVTITNCTFKDNFASDEGGHVYIGEGNTDIMFKNTTFRQSLQEMKEEEGSGFYYKNILYYSNSGSLLMSNTTFDSDTGGEIESLIRIAGLRNFKMENGSRIICPTGTNVSFQNLSYNTRIPDTDDNNLIFVLRWGCNPCGVGRYSPARGSWAPNEIGAIQCLTCPPGADCGAGKNLVAKKKYWCHQDGNDKVKCHPCLLNRCCSAGKTTVLNPKEYNYCCENRGGVLCSKCTRGYVELVWVGPSPCVLQEYTSPVFKFIVGIACVSLLFFLFIAYSIDKMKVLRMSACCDCGSCCSFSTQSISCTSHVEKAKDYVFDHGLNAIWSKCCGVLDVDPNFEVLNVASLFVFCFQTINIIIEEGETTPIRGMLAIGNILRGSPPVYPLWTHFGVELKYKVAIAPIFFAFCTLWAIIYVLLSVVQGMYGYQITPRVMKEDTHADKKVEERKKKKEDEEEDEDEDEEEKEDEDEDEEKEKEEDRCCKQSLASSALKLFGKILWNIWGFCYLPMFECFFKLVVPEQINDLCYNQYAAEEFGFLKGLCFGNSDGWPYVILGLGLASMVGIKVFVHCYRKKLGMTEGHGSNKGKKMHDDGKPGISSGQSGKDSLTQMKDAFEAATVDGSDKYRAKPKDVDVLQSASTENVNTTLSKDIEFLEFNRSLRRGFFRVLLAFLGVCVFDTYVRQSSIMFTLFLYFSYSLYIYDRDWPSRVDYVIELGIVALLTLISFLSTAQSRCIGTKDYMSDGDLSLGCLLIKVRLCLMWLLLITSLAMLLLIILNLLGIMFAWLYYCYCSPCACACCNSPYPCNNSSSRSEDLREQTAPLGEFTEDTDYKTFPTAKGVIIT